MSPSLADAFPDEGGVICNSFCTSADVSEKNWGSLERLAQTDDITFWTVICRHEKIASLVWNCAHAIDLAHSTASTSARRAVKREYELSLMLIVIRVATTTDVCLKRFVRSSDLARRVGEVLPLRVLLPASVTLLRRSGATASIVLTALCIINPAYLTRFPVQLSDFYDQVERIASRCTAEMKRGRFQRLAGDMLPLIEQCFRITKQVWAFLQSAPFMADYVSLPKMLRTLRIVVDVVSPCLQHFILVSDVLKNRRDVLSRANSMMINAALNTASVLVLYRTFDTPHARAACCPHVCSATYEQLSSFLLQYTKGVPFIVMANWKLTIQDLMHQLCAPDKSEDSCRVGIVLRQLMEPIENSRDFSDLFPELRPRFFELLLVDLVRQRFHIDSLLEQQFLTSDEAKRLGASEDAITRALAGLDVDEAEGYADAFASASPLPGTAAAAQLEGGNPPPQQPMKHKEPPEVVSDPLVAMVLDIFPFYNPVGVRMALSFYNNDVEQLILDASMENLPPHLVTRLTAPVDDEVAQAVQVPGDAAAAAATPAQAAPLLAAKRAANGGHLQTSDYDTTITDDLLQFYLGKDLYDAMTGSEDEFDLGDEDEAEYRTYTQGGGDHGQYADAGLAAAFQVDDDMKERIRLLNEIMYEDEFDDGQLEDVKAGVDDDEDRKERDQRAVVPRTVGPAAEGAANEHGAEGQQQQQQQPGIRRPPRSDYDDKRFHEKRAKERGAHIKDMKAGGGGNNNGNADANSNNNNNNSHPQKKTGANSGKGGRSHDDGKTHKHVHPAADGDNNNAPAYAKKKKVTKEKAGGKKGQLTRALKKGQLNSF